MSPSSAVRCLLNKNKEKIEDLKFETDEDEEQTSENESDEEE